MRRARAMLLAALVFPAGPTARVIDYNTDDPARLKPTIPVEMNLKSLDVKSRRSVPQKISPWSDVTWKANKGLVSQRYADSRFDQIPRWAGKRDFLRTYNVPWILRL